MKQFIIISSLFIVGLICSPLEALEDKIVPGEPTVKLIKSQGNVHLKRYGVRVVSEESNRHMKGLYKIDIGDADIFNDVHRMNRKFGFDGLVFLTVKEKKGHWEKIRVRRPGKDSQGQKETAVITKEHLPMPFNSMPDDLLGKIQFFNMYPKNDDAVVVYPEEGTGLSECEVIFNHIREKIWWLKNSATL